MNQTYRGKRQMERAFNKIRRQRMYPRCVKCGEETPWRQMSKENSRMCQDCWAIYDMDRLKEIEPEKEPEDDRTDK